jgi:hypothetical protein
VTDVARISLVQLALAVTQPSATQHTTAAVSRLGHLRAALRERGTYIQACTGQRHTRLCECERYPAVPTPSYWLLTDLRRQQEPPRLKGQPAQRRQQRQRRLQQRRRWRCPWSPRCSAQRAQWVLHAPWGWRMSRLRAQSGNAAQRELTRENQTSASSTIISMAGTLTSSIVFNASHITCGAVISVGLS